SRGADAALSPGESARPGSRSTQSDGGGSAAGQPGAGAPSDTASVDGRGGAGAVDCVRERGEFDAGARDGTRSRDCAANGAGGEPVGGDPAVVDGKRSAGCGGRVAGNIVGTVGSRPAGEGGRGKYAPGIPADPRRSASIGVYARDF